MKILLKKFNIFLVVFIVIAVSIFVSNANTVYESNDLYYSPLSSTTASLAGANNISDLVVPKSLDDYYITKIDDDAFNNNQTLNSLSLNNATMLSEIGSRAFQNCTNMSGNLVFSGRFSKFGYSSFQECSSLNSVVFNSLILTEIPDQCFYKCSSLSSVKLSNSITTINKLAFANCTSLNEIEIPKTVTSINASAFKNDTGLLIKGYRDSYAQEFALANGYDFYILDPLYGDANADGSVNILDVTAIQKYKIGTQELTEYGLRCADTDHNGTVTIRDATLIQMYLAHMINDF